MLLINADAQRLGACQAAKNPHHHGGCCCHLFFLFRFFWPFYFSVSAGVLQGQRWDSSPGHGRAWPGGLWGWMGGWVDGWMQLAFPYSMEISPLCPHVWRWEAAACARSSQPLHKGRGSEVFRSFTPSSTFPHLSLCLHMCRMHLGADLIVFFFIMFSFSIVYGLRDWKHLFNCCQARK